MEKKRIRELEKIKPLKAETLQAILGGALVSGALGAPVTVRVRGTS